MDIEELLAADIVGEAAADIPPQVNEAIAEQAADTLDAETAARLARYGITV